MLLNVPALDEADGSTGAPVHRQQAALLTKIAEWAAVSAQAAEQLGHLDYSGIAGTYAGT